MARHRVEICGVNTANIKVLKNEEMIELFKQYQQGNLHAKEQLIEGNLKLVLSILKKYQNKVDMDDLFQIGCIGLIKAIDNFDLSHEVRFSTYAVPMILGEVKRYLRDSNSAIRVTRSIKDLAYKSLKAKEELTNILNREPTLKQIALKLEVTENEVYQALEAMKDIYSLSEPINNSDGNSIYLSDQISKDKDNQTFDNNLILKEALNKLNKKERYIINQRYFEGKTQVELSNELGISQAQISRLEKNSLELMKNIIK